MTNYYGTAVKEPTGRGLPKMPIQKQLLRTVIWCPHETGGCPAYACRQCKLDNVDNIEGRKDA